MPLVEGVGGVEGSGDGVEDPPGILIFCPLYTHELVYSPLADANWLKVTPWRTAMLISVSPGRTMYVPPGVEGEGAGALFRVRPGVCGVPEFRSRILL